MKRRRFEHVGARSALFVALAASLLLVGSSLARRTGVDPERDSARPEVGRPAQGRAAPEAGGSGARSALDPEGGSPGELAVSSAESNPAEPEDDNWPQRVRPGERIFVHPAHVPPDVTVFEAKYAGVDRAALQAITIDFARALERDLRTAFDAERAAGRELDRPMPVLDQPGSPDHGRPVGVNPYENRIARMRVSSGSSGRMQITVLSPTHYSELYDRFAEQAWLVETLMAQGIDNPLAGAF